MKSIYRMIFSAVCFGMAAFAPTSVSAEVTTPALKDFEWFSTLGYPDLKDRSFVRVIREVDTEGAGRVINRNVGFLLSTNAASVRILKLDLSEGTYETLTDPEATPVQVDIERLEKEVAARLRAHRSSLNGEDQRWMGHPLPGRAEFFILAWACWRNGLNAEAQELYEAAEVMPGRFDRQDRAASFRDRLKGDLGYGLMWKAVDDFGKLSISRTRLIEQFRSIVRNYPDSEYWERAGQTVAVLERMIAEEATRAPLSAAEIRQLPVEEQVKEWIFRLRDQNGQQYSQPGWCDIFLDPRAPNTPAHHLLELGHAAVPQLIAALDDETFTRSVGYRRNFYFSHTVLTIGDCAAAILQRITGRSFLRSRPSATSLLGAADNTAVREAAEIWWAEFQRKGERQMLIAAVSDGGREAPGQAELLCKRYPESAADALMNGITKATDAWVQSRLIWKLSSLDDPRIAGFLTHELSEGPTLESRVASAFGLRQLGLPDPAVEAMIREWRKPVQPGQSPNIGRSSVMEFLAGADSVEAVHALEDRFDRHPIKARMGIIENLGARSTRGRHVVEERSAETWGAIEGMLVSALEDTEEDFGRSGGRDGKNYHDPRVCDMAGHFLSMRWPERYVFDLSASLPTRDRQRVQCINTWRSARNQPLLPVPEPATTRVSSQQATRVTAIEWIGAEAGPDPGERVRAAVDAFKDKPLVASDVATFLAGYAAEPDPNGAGVVFKAIKAEQLTGVRLIVRLLPGTPSTGSDGWILNERVVLGGKNLRSAGAGGIRDTFSDPTYWNDLVKAANQALNAEPTTPFLISVRLMAAPQR